MGISRVASEIQIYSAVYSVSSLIEVRVCRFAFARWLVVQPAECETLRAGRGNHICSITKLHILQPDRDCNVSDIRIGSALN